MNKQIIVTAALLGALAVVLGAFGAHGLQAQLSIKQLEVWQTAVQYQFYHVLALLILLTLNGLPNRLIKLAYYFFTFGILLFSGSLYLLACRYVLGYSWLVVFGPVTPVGGLLLISGWVTLVIAALKN